MPSYKMSQGIVCASPSLTITPYVTDAWSFNRPIEHVTRQNIYDENTGAIKYVQETPRFEKDNYNLNYGISPVFSSYIFCLVTCSIGLLNDQASVT